MLAACVVGCHKPDYELPVASVQLPSDQPVRDLLVINDTLYAVCGSAVFAIPQGTAVVPTPVFEAHVALHSLARHASEWFVGGDSVFMFRGAQWSTVSQFYWDQSDWVSDLSKHPIRAMAQNQQGLLAVAGGKLAFGVVYHTYNGGMSWNPQEPENELRCAYLIDDFAWAAGNGILLRSEWGSGEWKRMPLENLYITGITFTSSEVGWLVTQKGDIFKTNDNGENWKRVYNGRSSFMHAIVSEEQTLVAVGNDGLMVVSSDGGEHWRVVDVATNADLLDAEIWGERCYLATDDGEVISFLLTDLK